MAKADQLWRFLSAYYITNIACLGLYYLLRRNIDWDAAPKRYLKDADHLLYWEKRTAWMLLALAAGRCSSTRQRNSSWLFFLIILQAQDDAFLLSEYTNDNCRYFRRSTLDAYLAEVFGYIKVASVTVLAAVDFRLGICMALWIVISSLLFIQPRFSGSQKVDILTPASFDSQALSENASQPFWMIMLSAPWSLQSRQAQATFAELSLEYASEKLKFGELDVGRWPKVAKKYDMSIETCPNQLPTFLLLKQGKLVKRLPEADHNWERKGRLKALLIGHFDLDMVLASTLQQT